MTTIIYKRIPITITPRSQILSTFLFDYYIQIYISQYLFRNTKKCLIIVFIPLFFRVVLYKSDHWVQWAPPGYRTSAQDLQASAINEWKRNNWQSDSVIYLQATIGTRDYTYLSSYASIATTETRDYTDLSSYASIPTTGTRDYTYLSSYASIATTETRDYTDLYSYASIN